ncbi:MAG: hypothetical protein ACKO33_00720 [Bacteroidota bacterium]
MEVHHPSHPTHKKKAKEYLVEFFMLFTAVTLGFFAENVREIYVEKERAHEYVTRLEVDIKSNIYFIDSLLNFNYGIEYQMDSVLVELTSNKNSFDLAFFYNHVYGSFPRFLSKNDTYEQMKSAGFLRYIKDPALLALIIDYSNEAEAAEYRSREQEASYLLGEYASLLIKWQPPEVSIKKYLQHFESSKERLGVPDSLAVQLGKIANYKEEQPIFISGVNLEAFKKEIIPAMGRRLALMKTTLSFLQRTKSKGLQVLSYLEDHHN